MGLLLHLGSLSRTARGAGGAAAAQNSPDPSSWLKAAASITRLWGRQFTKPPPQHIHQGPWTGSGAGGWASARAGSLWPSRGWGQASEGLQTESPFPGSAGFEAPVCSVGESQRPGTLLPPANQPSRQRPGKQRAAPGPPRDAGRGAQTPAGRIQRRPVRKVTFWD